LSHKNTSASKLHEIRWHGRGGQGAITAAKITAQAAHYKGYRGVTAAPSFGAERRGAPVSASTRIHEEHIKMLSSIEKPDIVVALDDTLLKYEEVTSGLSENGWLVVNSKLSPEELGLNGDYNVATADATGVCEELGLTLAGLTLVNTAILGALVYATDTVDLEVIERVIKERFGGDGVEKNLEAVRRTHRITRVLRKERKD
jgi:pyruvate ferredoxin oxidoreductase gamma subunit